LRKSIDVRAVGSGSFYCKINLPYVYVRPSVPLNSYPLLMYPLTDSPPFPNNIFTLSSVFRSLCSPFYVPRAHVLSGPCLVFRPKYFLSLVPCPGPIFRYINPFFNPRIPCPFFSPLLFPPSEHLFLVSIWSFPSTGKIPASLQFCFSGWRRLPFSNKILSSQSDPELS